MAPEGSEWTAGDTIYINAKMIQDNKRKLPVKPYVE